MPSRFNPVANLLAVALVITCANAAWAASIYVYQRSDGSRLITDHKRHEPGYRLVKVYGINDNGWASVSPSKRRRLRAVPSRFDALIRNTALRFGVDAALIKAVMHVESGFDPKAISKKGASGLMQLMPNTATRYGVKRIFDPNQNIIAGVRYLRDLLSEFNGDTRLALAGYNAGENAVIKYRGVPPYSETKGYILKVMSLYQQYRATLCTNGSPVACS